MKKVYLLMLIGYANWIMPYSTVPHAKFIYDSLGWFYFFLAGIALFRHLKKRNKRAKKLTGRAPIIAMIDKSTGYDAAMIKQYLLDIQEGYKELVKLFKRIGDEVQIKQYTELLAKVKTALSADFKTVKPIKYQ